MKGALFAALRRMFLVPDILKNEYMEEDRGPVARTDFKSDEACSTRLVGSTPALFRQPLRVASMSAR